MLGYLLSFDFAVRFTFSALAGLLVSTCPFWSGKRWQQNAIGVSGLLVAFGILLCIWTVEI